mmetsp:Transcript_19809/g.14563  ORF Transcript_19809/g.14563 Transcript_19809/m.14563 type:complete len:96 (+) Transcript_19809:139-426(+)
MLAYPPGNIYVADILCPAVEAGRLSCWMPGCCGLLKSGANPAALEKSVSSIVNLDCPTSTGLIICSIFEKPCPTFAIRSFGSRYGILFQWLYSAG